MWNSALNCIKFNGISDSVDEKHEICTGVI